MTRKGIVLAGGSGTRLNPITATINKHLLPVYNKPMIYYPLSMLMLGGMREILVISTPKDLANFQELLGDGSQWGIQIEYAQQGEPRGLVDAFLIAESFLDGSHSCLVLGDNLFYGNTMGRLMKEAAGQRDVATIFGYPVKDPERFAVVEFDEDWNVISLEEKPQTPRSTHAVPGVYFYDDQAVALAKQVKPSLRGELEITSLNQLYLEKGKLQLQVFGRGVAWFDAGTPHSLLQAANFVEAIEERQSLMIACLEEIALTSNWIDRATVNDAASQLGTGTYAQYLKRIASSKGESL